MERTTLVKAVVAAVVFAAAGYFVGAKFGNLTNIDAAKKAKDCRGHDCDILIKFTCVDDSHPTTATCVPYAENDLVLVSRGKKIVFSLDSTDDFKFDGAEGIKFTSANSDGYFPCQSQGPKKFKCDNNGPPSEMYKYSIYVQGMNKVDPFVVNY